MRIETATPQDVYDVARDMREKDYLEFTAVSHADTREELAQALVNRCGENTICAWHNTTPAAIGAAVEGRPNVISLMFFATHDVEQVMLPLTKFIRQRLFPPLIAAGVHRIECVSSEWYVEAHRWIELLGLKRETNLMLGYGKNRENFYQFSWTSDVCKAGHRN